MINKELCNEKYLQRACDRYEEWLADIPTYATKVSAEYGCEQYGRGMCAGFEMALRQFKLWFHSDEEFDAIIQERINALLGTEGAAC